MKIPAKQKYDDSAALDDCVQVLDDEPDSPGGAFDDPVVEAARDGYAKSVRPFHSWLMRKTVDFVISQLPSLEEAVVMMAPGLGDAEREDKVFSDMRRYVDEGRPVAAALDALFADLNLEDVRQV